MKAREVMAKRIFTKCGIIIGFALVLSIWLLMPLDEASAETRTWKGSNYITKFEAIPTLITPGHFIGVFERQGESLFDNGEKTKTILRGTVDLNMDIGEGSFQGYSFVTYEDGSITITKVEGAMKLPPGGRLPISEGKGTYIKGTGRFQGIQGTMSFKSNQIKPYGGEHKGDAVIEGVSTYTLPAK